MSKSQKPKKLTYEIFRVVLHKSEYGYDVHVPALSGCVSQGDTELQALENIKDAIKTYRQMEAEEIKGIHDTQVREVEVALS